VGGGGEGARVCARERERERERERKMILEVRMQQGTPTRWEAGTQHRSAGS
jgi:hypothetical protein